MDRVTDKCMRVKLGDKEGKICHNPVSLSCLLSNYDLITTCTLFYNIFKITFLVFYDLILRRYISLRVCLNTK